MRSPFYEPIGLKEGPQTLWVMAFVFALNLAFWLLFAIVVGYGVALGWRLGA